MIFDPLTAASLLVLASSSEGLCALPGPTQIDIRPTTKATIYDYSKTLADLQGEKVDTIDPHSFNGVSVTQGFMNGAIKLVPKISLNYRIFKINDAACVWYEKISIDIELAPTITIAKEVKADECMNEAVSEHERKHVRVDRQIVNKYAQIMGREIKDELEQRGFIAGPVRTAQMDDIAKRMQETVFQLVEHQYKKMDLERVEKQRDIDSLEEYNRISAACPDFNPIPKDNN